MVVTNPGQAVLSKNNRLQAAIYSQDKRIQKNSPFFGYAVKALGTEPSTLGIDATMQMQKH
jgi:hypothetical protein